MNQRLELMNRKQEFILSYCKNNIGTDVLDMQFLESWLLEFGGKRSTLSRFLKSMYDQGMLNRTAVSFSEAWKPGMPIWVYQYTLTEVGRSMTRK